MCHGSSANAYRGIGEDFTKSRSEIYQGLYLHTCKPDCDVALPMARPRAKLVRTRTHLERHDHPRDDANSTHNAPGVSRQRHRRPVPGTFYGRAGRVSALCAPNRTCGHRVRGDCTATSRANIRCTHSGVGLSVYMPIRTARAQEVCVITVPRACEVLQLQFRQRSRPLTSALAQAIA